MKYVGKKYIIYNIVLCVDISPVSNVPHPTYPLG